MTNDRSNIKYDAAVELARGKLGVLSAGHGPGRVVLLRRIEAKPPWSSDLLEGIAESARRVQPIHHPSLLAVIDVVPSPNDVSGGHRVRAGCASPHSDVARSATEEADARPRSAPDRRRAGSRPGGADALLRAQGDTRALSGLHPECIIISSGDDALIADLGMVALERVPNDPEIVAYRAPEPTPGPSTPVYGLGLILWELLAGRDAFGQSAPSSTAAQVRKQAADGRIPRLDRIVRNVPALLVELVMQSINRDPAARFPTIAAFSEALGAVAETRRPGELLRYMNELCSDIIDRQRSGLVLSNIAAASWRPTVHTVDALAQIPEIPKAPRAIGLAAFRQAEPKPDSGRAVDSLLGRGEGHAGVPSAPSITIEQPISVDVPVAPLSVPRQPQATAPLLLVKPTGTPLPGAVEIRTASPVAPALAFDPDDYTPPVRRRWGLVFFVLLVLGGAAALAAFAIKKQLEVPKNDDSPPIIPTLGLSGGPAESGSAPLPSALGSNAPPTRGKVPYLGPVRHKSEGGPGDAAAAAASSSAPATTAEPEGPSDNPYRDPPPKLVPSSGL